MQLSTKILVGMGAGIIVGLLFNALGGSDPTESALITWIVENIFDVIGKIFEGKNKVKLDGSINWL